MDKETGPETIHAADDDDGQDVVSHLLLGPFHLGGSYGLEGMISEIISNMADDSAAIIWRTVAAETAEEAVDKASAAVDLALAGDPIVGVHASGTWGDNHNRPSYPRTRGAFGVLWLESAGKWSYEMITFFATQLGRLRI